MSQSILTFAQSKALYIAYLQQQIARMLPALRNNPVYVTVNPNTNQSVALSYPQLLGEVQRNSPIGQNEVVKYASAQGYQVAV